MRRVVVLFNEPCDGADTAELDVLDQVQAVREALGGAAEVCCFGVTLNLAALDAELVRHPPDVVFNLVEALGGNDRLGTLVPLLLESRGIRYTGAGAAAQIRLADKARAKASLRAAGLPTPDWFVPGGKTSRACERFPGAGSYIVKARCDHASMGLDDHAIVRADTAAELEAAIGERTRRFGAEFFAERFIPGREFNLALLQRSGTSVEVLPPAEIDFSAFTPDKPRIVGYNAKWREDSFEYLQTPRRFDLPVGDAELATRLEGLARRAWALFGLRGYARVDYRVDQDGIPWILELNFNPCLSPDAGFAAALAAAGIPFPAALERVLDAAATDAMLDDC